MPSVYHMVHYRRFEANNTGVQGQTLETLCRTALGSVDLNNSSLWDRPNDRLLSIGDADGRQIVLNKVADLSSAVFGEMCLVQDKDSQALLELKVSSVKLSNITTAQIFNLDERTAPQGSQFVRGMAYWLAIGNHLFFVKTHSMIPDFIKAYLNWLLKTRSAAMPHDVMFDLQAEFDKSQVAGDIGDIRSLRLSGKSAPQLVVSPVPEQGDGKVVETARTVAGKFVEFGQAVPVVEALFGKPRTESLVDSLGPGEYLSVDAAVKIRGRRTEKSRAKLRSLANDIADLSDAKVQIEGKDGKVTDGDAILRTRMPFNQPHEGSHLLEFDNVADQLQEVYMRYVNDGKIMA
jgi:hypothetical protein